MRLLKIVYLLLGIGLLVVVLAQVDVDEVWSKVRLIGVVGMCAVVAIYAVGFAIDSFTWQMALGVPLNLTWLWRAFRVRVVGEMFNAVIPAAGMGGEPVKAEILKKDYGISYRAGTASIILGRTINMIGELVFLAVGFALVWTSTLGGPFKTAAAIGLVAFVAATVGFFYFQRLKISSRTGRRLAKWRLTRRVEDVLHHIHDLDERLVAFYAGDRARFAAAVFLAFLNWVAGVVEIYVTMAFLGHPVTFAEAWIIEAVVQLVRSAAFFIPVNVGAQEGAFLVVYAALTGSPTIGVAVSVIRRFREVIWLVAGAALVGIYPATRRRAASGKPGA